MNERTWLDQICQDMQVDSVTVRLYHCAPDWNMRERVVGDDMFFYVLKGKGRVTVEQRAYPLKAGGCAHFRRKVRHSGSHDPRHPIDVITLHYNATVMQSLSVPELLGFPDMLPQRRGGLWENYLLEALQEATEDKVGTSRVLETIVTRLLIHLIQHFGDLMTFEYRETRRQDLVRLQPALRRMSDNLAQPESIEYLARLAGLSVAQFRKIFSRCLHLSPVRYQQRLRMSRACWLLRNSALTIEAIAGEVGYHETSFFARAFKEIIGVSPGRYRSRIGP